MAVVKEWIQAEIDDFQSKFWPNDELYLDEEKVRWTSRESAWLTARDGRAGAARLVGHMHSPLTRHAKQVPCCSRSSSRLSTTATRTAFH